MTDDEIQAAKVRCWGCQGSKIIMGGGCIMKDCHVCNGEGFLYKASEVNTLVEAQKQAVAQRLDEDLPVMPAIPKKPRKLRKLRRRMHADTLINVAETEKDEKQQDSQGDVVITASH